MFGGSHDFEDEYGNQWHNLPYAPRERPDRDDEELREIFDNNGWRNWGDFYGDKLGLERSDPTHSRTPFLGDIVDLIKDLYDRANILNYTTFEFLPGGYIDYEIGDTT
jgi:hypothetical protein